MKKLRRILGLCLVLAASTALVVACGPTEGNDCTFDTDCGANEVCLQPTGDSNRCVTECTDDATACATGEECHPRFPNSGEPDQSACIPSDLECTADSQCPGDVTCDTDNSVCMIGEGTEDCTEDADCDTGETCNTDTGMCESDTGCTEDADCDTGEVCNDDGMCVPGQVEYFVVEITDTTDPASEACTNPSDDDPGSDLMTAELIINGESSYAQYLGFATTGGEDNALGLPPQHLEDGVAPSYDISANMCPENFNDQTVMSLGCGGKLWVVFASADGDVAIPTDGTADMYVYEYGEPLCGSDPSDTYQVELCDAPSRDDIEAAAMPGDFDCTGPVLVEEGQGEAAVTPISVQ